MIALLALCSAAEAAPLSRPASNPPSSDLPLIEKDLGFSQDSVEQALPDEPDVPLLTTSIDADVALSEQDLNREPDFTWVPASEPPPVTTIALGFTFLGAASFMRRRRAEKRRARRRTLVRMRAIIAER